ncbi:MAG: DNA repair protein RecO [Candidatus Competibacteraceae bacterium]|uniref:DNA repair protein RecO n=1 Tax=Candidatus Contendobacter odensis Run_B_J11 TaxID=1400861 RepID=A0A7U7GB97_9GAMM|nr:DNA repair protein RecO [Candidatus Contendobacter odensis]MBK8534785.1 DNA repair protein RecO [Candidatus Competibacteraceae bacterium]MBK8753564.1 DNA repair protein RecO [Candidatus Competibacteraceae bacterium]CDH45241.1 gap repair protein, part of RecFOR complex that targets RecA to ssDNA-dsDNA junction [Candidatus Contendobacter odensis Run_B_J11]
MRALLQSAFILHRRPYRNTSVLLEVFSQERGRLGLVARGAAAPKSRLKGLLQPFAPLLLSWSGVGELAALIAAEEAGLPIALPPNRVLAGLYVNELLVRLLPRLDPLPGLFAAYEVLLAELVTVPGEEPPLRRFEKRLLEELGYGLTLDCEAISGMPIVAEEHYRYVLDRGPLAVHRTELGVPISGQGLLALRDGILVDPTVLSEVKRLTRAALAVQLHGRALKTRELYRSGRR